MKIPDDKKSSDGKLKSNFTRVSESNKEKFRRPPSGVPKPPPKPKKPESSKKEE